MDKARVGAWWMCLLSTISKGPNLYPSTYLHTYLRRDTIWVSIVRRRVMRRMIGRIACIGPGHWMDNPL